MFIIWRRHGFLILPAVLLAWWLSDSVIQPIYKNAAGYTGGLYNAEKAICWAIALGVVAVLIFVYWLLFLRNEGKPMTDEQFERLKEAKREYLRMANPEVDGISPEQALAQVDAEPKPAPAKSSTFFFIPFKFFPVIFVAIGILLLVVNVPVAMEEFRVDR